MKIAEILLESVLFVQCFLFVSIRMSTLSSKSECSDELKPPNGLYAASVLYLTSDVLVIPWVSPSRTTIKPALGVVEVLLIVGCLVQLHSSFTHVIFPACRTENIGTLYVKVYQSLINNYWKIKASFDFNFPIVNFPFLHKIIPAANEVYNSWYDILKFVNSLIENISD